MIIIKNKVDCTGCTACASICPINSISLQIDEEGFYYPITDEKRCIKCGLCNKACPLNTKKETTNQSVAYAAYIKDENILEESSSGGVFYALAKEFISCGGIVYGATLTEDISVQHIGIEKAEDIFKIMGSKYVQSSLNKTYFKIKKSLQDGRRVMFVGTPCQVAGLLSFLGDKYDSLITVDFVCHGVPSPKVFSKYISYLERKYKKEICNVKFRSKRISWNKFSFVAKFKDNTELAEEFTKNTYMKGFINNLFLRPSCHKCQFKKIVHESDITLADFWGIQDIKPHIYTNKGVSLCYINSQNGSILFNKIKNELFTEEVSFDESIKHNSAYTESAKANRMRKWFFAHLDSLPVIKNIEQSLSPNLTIRLLLKFNRKKYRRESWN